MAKKSKKSRSAISSPIARPRPAPLLQSHSTVSALRSLSDRLKMIEDRRQWSPHGKQRSARSFNAAHHKLVVKKAPVKPHRGSLLSSKVAFHAPKKVLVCVRRKIRKEILFAFKATSKGSAARRRRRSVYSSVVCS